MSVSLIEFRRAAPKADVIERFFDACQPGRVFFTFGAGWWAAYKRGFQRRRARPKRKTRIPNHVGLVGFPGASGVVPIHESTLWRGPSERPIADYLDKRGEIVIADWRVRMSGDEIRQGIEGMLAYRNRVESQKRYVFGEYDWISLLSWFGLQQNNAAICSEYVMAFRNEALRYRRGYQLVYDRLVLPVDIWAITFPILRIKVS